MTGEMRPRERELTERETLVTNRSRGLTGRFEATESEVDRFWSQVDRNPVTGRCWLWTGRINDDDYGVVTITLAPGVYRTVRAHRHAWEQLVGPIAPGLTLDHLIPPDGPCTSRLCVNPAHLEPVTRAENARRARRRERLLLLNGDAA